MTGANARSLEAAPAGAPPDARVPAGTAKLAVLCALCFTSMAIMTPVLDALVREPFGVGNDGTAKFMAANGVSSLLFGILAGIFSDRIGRRVPIIAFALLGNGAFTALLPHIDSFPLLLAVRFIDGAFGGASLGLIMTRALDEAGPGNRNRTMGVMSLAISAGFIAAPILASQLAHRSLPLLFGLSGGALVAGGLWMMADLGRPERLAPAGGSLRDLFGVLADRPMLAIPIAFSFVEKFTFGTLAHLTSLIVKDVHERGTQASSYVILGFWLAFSAACPLAARLCDRFGSIPTIIAGSLLYGASFAALGLLGFGGFAAMMMLTGAFCAVHYVPSVAMVGEFAGESRRGFSMGLWNMAGSLGIIAGMVASGRISEASYARAYAAGGGLEIAAALAVGAGIWAAGRIASRPGKSN